MPAEIRLDWQRLLDEALTTPGNLTGVYDRFHDYSLTNMLLFRMQGIHEPVASFARWKSLGRHVLKGSRAKEVIVPVLVKGEPEPDDEPLEEKRERVAKLIGFKVVRAVFGYSDTEGPEITPPPLPDWDLTTALGKLAIRQVPFDLTEGNIQGYSHGTEIAINPMAVYPNKTLMHEIGHVVLGHTTGQDPDMHRGLREFQAEAVAYLTMNELDQLDEQMATVSRGYVQHWLQDEQPPDKAIQQVFRAAEAILRAGRVDP